MGRDSGPNDRNPDTVTDLRRNGRPLVEAKPYLLVFGWGPLGFLVREKVFRYAG
jgi:hypothetical protein